MGQSPSEYYAAVKRHDLQKRQHNEPRNMTLSKKIKAEKRTDFYRKGKSSKTQNVWLRNTYLLEKHKERQRKAVRHSGHWFLPREEDEFRERLPRHWVIGTQCTLSIL